MIMKNIFFIGLLVVSIFACKKETPVLTSEIDDDLILAYLDSTGLDSVAIKHASGLYYVIEKKGNGVFPTYYSKVEVEYKGYFLDGVVFDEGKLQQELSTLIRGWQYGIPLFSEGGEGKLFIPRSLGYGVEVLVFDIKLINVY